MEQRKTSQEWQLSQVGFAMERLQQAIKGQAFFVAPRIDGFPQINEAAIQLASLESQKRSLLIDFTEAHPEVEEITEEVLQTQRDLLSLYLTASRELEMENQRLVSKIALLDSQFNDAPEAELAKRTRDRKSQTELLSFLQEKQRQISTRKEAQT